MVHLHLLHQVKVESFLPHDRVQVQPLAQEQLIVPFQLILRSDCITRQSFQFLCYSHRNGQAIWVGIDEPGLLRWCDKFNCSLDDLSSKQ